MCAEFSEDSKISAFPLQLNREAAFFAKWLIDNNAWLQENRGKRLAHRDGSLLPYMPASFQWTQPTRECTLNPKQCRYPFGESLFACYTNANKTDLCPATQASAQWYDRLRNEGDFIQVSQ